MTRKSILKIAVLAVFLLLITLMVLPVVQKEGTATKLYLGAGDNEPQLLEDFSAIQNNYYPCSFMLDGSKYSLDSTDGKWESKTIFGDSALYFGLNTTAIANYSAQATITTPRLILADNTYILTLDYFSSRESDFPNYLTISSSEDGDRFINHTTEAVFFTDNTYNTLSIELPYNTKYISVYAKVYADDGRTNSGIYIDNIGLTAVNSHDLTDATFSATLDEDTFIYDGSAKTPTYNIECSLEAPYFPYVFVSDTNVLNYGNQIDAINVGTYYLHIAIFNICNEQVDAITLPFTIEKSALTLDINDLQYCTYEAFLFVFNLPLLNESGNYVSLYNNQGLTYTITHNGVDTTSHDNVTRLLFDGEFSLRITIDESANYYGVVSDSITIGQTRFDGIYLRLIYTSRIYTGRADGLGYHLYVSSDENDPYNLNSTHVVSDEEDFSIIYTIDGVEVEPIKVGKYIATITYREMVWHINYEITKAEIKYAFYRGSYSLDKTYDGSDMLYYTYKENINDTQTVTSAASTFKQHEFAVPQIYSTDDATLIFGRVNFNYTYGKVKLLFNDISIVGSDASNYVLASDFSNTLEGDTFNITPANLSLAPQSDSSNTLLIKQKTYDGTLDAEIDYASLETLYGNLDLVPLEFYGLSHKDNIDINKLAVFFTSIYGGQREVILQHNDPMLLDRYKKDISLNNLIHKLEGTITPLSLELDKTLSTITVAPKVFSGDNIAHVSIKDCSYNTPLLKDVEIINNFSDLFAVVYDSAIYSQVDAGENIEITISGARMVALFPNFNDLALSYSINDIVLSGNITPKEVFVITEHLRIDISSEIPELVIDPIGTNINLSYYNTLLDAQNKSNALLALPVEIGTYYIRVDCGDTNHYINGGYSIVSLVITNEKVDQIIVFDYANYLSENKITMLKGGSLVPKAYTTNLLGEKTYLDITYMVSGNPTLYNFDSITLSALDVGTISITASQAGNDFYNAKEVTIDLDIVDYSIDTSAYNSSPNVYLGALPTFTEVALVNSKSIVSHLIAVDTQVEKDKTTYNYNLCFDDTYVGLYALNKELTPTPYTITVAFPAVITRYVDQSTSFLSVVTLKISGGDYEYIPSPNEYHLYGLSFAFDADQHNLAAGSYSLVFSGSDPYFVGITTSEYYTIDPLCFEPVTLIIEKISITITVPQFTKFYGQPPIAPNIDDVIFDSAFTLEDEELDMLKAGLIFSLSCNTFSPVGSYLTTTSFGTGYAMLEASVNFIIINSYVTILPAPITITTTAPSSMYKTAIIPYEVVIEGLYLSSDESYLRSNITTSLIGADINSNAGTYTIFVEYNGTDSNYLFTVVNGAYSILPAPFSGITFESKKFLYDNEKHSIALSFAEIIEDIEVVYNIVEQVEIGVYTVTATVSKFNFATTTYTAKLTISTLALVSPHITDKIEILDLTEDTTGFSPDIILNLKTSEVVGIENKVKAKLNKSYKEQESIVAIYDLSLMQDSMPVVLTNGLYRIRLSLPSLPTDTDIRILASVNNELVAVTYTFEDGYFVFETDSIYGIAILKTTQIIHSKISTILVVSVIAFVLLIAVFLIPSTFIGRKEAKMKSRKRHHKWS